MTDDTDQTDTIVWYRSKIIRRLALSIAVQILSVTHLTSLFASADLTLLVDDLLEAAGIAYAAWAVHARVTKPIPPVALTQAKADIANSAAPAASVVTERLENP